MHLTGPLERQNLKAQSGPLDQSRTNTVEAFRPFSGQLDSSKVTRAVHTEHGVATGPSDIEMSRLQPGQPHKSTGLPDYLRYLPGQVEQQTRAHSGQLDQPKVAAVDYWKQPAAATNPFLHYGDTNTWLADHARFGKEDDVRSVGDSTRPLLSTEESWALFDGVNRNGNAPAEPPSQVSMQCHYWSDFGLLFTRIISIFVKRCFCVLVISNLFVIHCVILCFTEREPNCVLTFSFCPDDCRLQASFFNLLVDKDSGSKVVPGRPDHVRNPSDRSESALPLLHHARRNGSFDSYSTGASLLKFTLYFLPIILAFPS